MRFSNLKHIFLPAFLLSIFLAFSTIFLQLSRNSLISTLPQPAFIPFLKIHTLIPSIILALILFITSKKHPFDQVIRKTLLILAGIIALLVAFVFFQKHLPLPEMLNERLPDAYKPFISNWTAFLFWTISSMLSFPLFSILIWGFVNQTTTTQEALKCYLPLAFVFGNIFGFTPLLMKPIKQLGLPFTSIVICALFCMLIALFIFNWAWKHLPNNRTPVESRSIQTPPRFPIIKAAYLMGGCALSKSFITILFKMQMRAETTSPSAYSVLMGKYSMVLGSASILFSILWLILGAWILLRKGWKSTALFTSMSILVGSLIFFGEMFLNRSTSLITAGVYNGLLTGTTSILFFPLIQLLYLYLPAKIRFRTKITTEMICLPIITALSPLIMQMLILAFGSLSAITIYLKILPLIFILLLILATKRISSQFTDKTIAV